MVQQLSIDSEEGIKKDPHLFISLTNINEDQMGVSFHILNHNINEDHMGVTQLETLSSDMLLGVDKTRPRVQ